MEPESRDEAGSDVGPGRPPVEHRFKPGQSGNPKGRTPGVARAAQKLIGKRGEKALQFLADLMNGKVESTILPGCVEDVKMLIPPVKERRLAAEALLDRACGKAMQPVEVSGPGGAPVESRIEVAFVDGEPERDAG